MAGKKCSSKRVKKYKTQIKEVEDDVDYLEDLPGELMIAPVSRESAITQNHCALDSELCLPSINFGSLVRQSGSDDCRGGDEARERSLSRWEDSGVDRDCTLAGEHLRGHLQFCFDSPFGQSRSRGGACFSTVCPIRLSVYTSTRILCGVSLFSDFP